MDMELYSLYCDLLEALDNVDRICLDTEGIVETS